jgi:transcriptional regulator with PAS, ATPase and Fis domain
MESRGRSGEKRLSFYAFGIKCPLVINLPPLREWKGDVELLAHHFLKEFSQRYKKNVAKISSAVMNLLRSYDFPVNVRELMNEVQPGITPWQS